MSLRSACVVALFALATSRLGAQQSNADVPRDLVVAYVRATNPVDSGTAVDIVSGAVPAPYQELVHLPSAVRVTGTVTTRRSATVLASATEPPDSVLRAIGREYGQAGWPGVSRVTIPAAAGNPGGFRPAPSGFPTLFCHDGHEVNALASRTSDGFTLVQLRIQLVSPTCGRLPNTRPASPPPQPRSPLPLLRNPDDAQMRPECYNIGSTQRSDVQIMSSLTPAAMFEYYAKQLETQGWIRLPETPSARASFSRRDTTGVQELATLSISGNPSVPTCRNATIEVTTLRNR